MASLSWPGFCFSNVFANKRHVAPKLSLVNVAGLNKVIRSEVFVSEERQLRAIHLILDFKPLLENFQDVGHAIRAGDPLLARIDVLVLGFLAWEDLIPVKLPFYRSFCEVAIPREETASSCLSLETKIKQFCLEGEVEEQEEPVVQILDSVGEFNRSFVAHFPKLI